jgi:hypothetical protein
MYDESFWNKRYANRDYLYGTEPNSFLAEHCHLLRGPVLSLSEGEGRNGFAQKVSNPAHGSGRICSSPF